MRLAVVAGSVVRCDWDRCCHDSDQPRSVAVNPMEPKKAMLHGRPVMYAEAGAGPVLLLVHGMGGGYENWREVIEPLARHHTVVAPDLPGHGASPPGNGDYSIGTLAAGLRDLLLALRHQRATLVGHSLGGGIAMQLAYQFPELAERLVLVSSGGLGPEVSLVLRAAALPGSELWLTATARTASWAGAAVGRGLSRVGCGRRPTSQRLPAAMRRSRIPVVARRSWPPCAQSST
jgi:pimeloyl-ACP methyl ester carboxylesterase